MAGSNIKPILIQGNEAIITLTQGKFARIDAEDVALVENFSWKAVRLGEGKLYAMAWTPRVDGERQGVLLHRLLLSAPKGLQVDHADNDGLNCRRANIRLATHSENRRNVGKNVRNKSGFKGVKAVGRRWRAQITFGGRQNHLGYFATAEDAHAAYAEAAKLHHGQFACP